MEVMSLRNCMVPGIIMITKLNTWLTQVHLDTHTNLLKLASDAQGFVANYALSPAAAYTPHIYLSALPLSSPLSSVRLQYLPQFKGLIKVSGPLLNKMGKAALGTWPSACSILATFSPDGDCIILGDFMGAISVKNAYDGTTILQPFKVHADGISSLGVSSDGMQILSGSYDRTLSIWNARDGSLISGPFEGHTDAVTSIAFSPDAAFIVSGSMDSIVGIWNAHNAATPMRPLTGHKKGVKSVAFSPDGSRVVSGSIDRTVRLWDLSSGATIFTLHDHASDAIQFTPNGSYIVSGSNDCSIRIWNTSDGSLIRQSEMAHSDEISSIAVSPNGGRIVTASGDYSYAICVWDTHSGKLIAGPFEGHADWITSVGFSGDGVRVVSVSNDNTVRVWNAHGQIQPEKGWQETHGDVYISTSCSQTHVALHFGPAFEAPEFEFHVWNLQTITRVVISTGADIEHLWFSLDGARIYSLHTTGTICTWDTQTAELLDGPHRCSTLEKWNSATCSADGTRVVTCDGSKAELWHVKTNRRRKQVRHQ
ncbi:hypothetical protein RSAG8_13072, partial [Rhizoctonia solani AG-8 WAC10335]